MCGYDGFIDQGCFEINFKAGSLGTLEFRDFCSSRAPHPHPMLAVDCWWEDETAREKIGHSAFVCQIEVALYNPSKPLKTSVMCLCSLNVSGSF